MKIICVGRNYRDHAKELANPVPQQPLIFTKPETALLLDNKDFVHPPFSQNIHFECELVYQIGKSGKNIAAEKSLEYVDGIGLGIDFTARDLQDKAKEKRHPWTLAKMFDHSAATSAMLAPGDFAHHADLRFELKVNGETRQLGHSADMIFDLGTLLAFISQYISLHPGDLLYTGTPAGVGPVQRGDHLLAQLEGHKLIDFHVR